MVAPSTPKGHVSPLVPITTPVIHVQLVSIRPPQSFPGNSDLLHTHVTSADLIFGL